MFDPLDLTPLTQDVIDAGVAALREWDSEHIPLLSMNSYHPAQGQPEGVYHSYVQHAEPYHAGSSSQADHAGMESSSQPAYLPNALSELGQEAQQSEPTPEALIANREALRRTASTTLKANLFERDLVLDKLQTDLNRQTRRRSGYPPAHWVDDPHSLLERIEGKLASRVRTHLRSDVNRRTPSYRGALTRYLINEYIMEFRRMKGSDLYYVLAVPADGLASPTHPDRFAHASMEVGLVEIPAL
ncbi:uncharacterized protein PFL1_00239 [Pseudozyma flocculosa PF-1]|uniref:uncharacterized protein n=1 Tax=Pseudozyma flocculosa PF-1 TaxID=1277687 RepID=UPI000456166C|nr:uncharacterized protein PFL1_00239 [Pseudozyma flocculosa PF-1]EPQ32041.1 hypothetical protein PFL1_00239 [Pseudozyma flocculosa PF-1]